MQQKMVGTRTDYQESSWRQKLHGPQKVVAQLKSIVEYQDEYDPATGKIKVTG